MASNSKTFTAGKLRYVDVNQYLMSQANIICTSGTRPASSLVAGMHIWETDTQRELYYNGSTWVPKRRLGMFVRKTANETVNNSATLQNDDELTLPALAGSVYFAELFIIHSADSAADMKFFLTVPSGAVLSFATLGPNASQTNRDSVTINQLAGSGSAISVGCFGVGSNQVTIVRASIKISSTAGSVTLQWAQSSAAVNNAVVNANSYMWLRRMT